MNRTDFIEKNITVTNMRLAQTRVQWLIEHSCSHHLLWCIDSFVLPCLPVTGKHARAQTAKLLPTNTKPKI